MSNEAFFKIALHSSSAMLSMMKIPSAISSSMYCPISGKLLSTFAIFLSVLRTKALSRLILEYSFCHISILDERVSERLKSETDSR